MPKKQGRKGKYQEWLTKDGLTQLEGWARDGLTDEQIANNIGIQRTTLYDWKNKYPDISDSLKRGKAPVDIEVENALLKRALGYTVKETRTIVEKTPDGDIKQRAETIEKHIAPDVTAQIFWLKNRKPEIWRERQNIDVQNNIKIEDNSERFRKYLRELDGGDNDDGGMGQDSSE